MVAKKLLVKSKYSIPEMRSMEFFLNCGKKKGLLMEKEVSVVFIEQSHEEKKPKAGDFLNSFGKN